MKNGCHCINIRRASNTLTEYYDRAISSHGLTTNQYSILYYVREIQPCSTSELSKKVRLDRTTLVRTLKPLYEKKLIVDDSGENQRSNSIRLTNGGLKTVEDAAISWEKAHNKIESLLGKDKVEALTEALVEIYKLNYADTTDGAREKGGKKDG